MPCVRDIFLPIDSSITQIKQIYCYCSLGSRLVVIILELSRPIVWLVRHVCSDKAKFSFLLKKPLLTLFQTCTKLTFGLSDVFVVTVIARNRINSVGSLFFRDRILRFG